MSSAQKFLENVPFGEAKSIRGKGTELFKMSAIDTFWETVGNGDYLNAARLAAGEPKFLGRAYVRKAYEEALDAGELGQAASIDAEYSVIDRLKRAQLYDKASEEKKHEDAALIAKKFGFGKEAVREHAIKAYEECMYFGEFEEALQEAIRYELGGIMTFNALAEACRGKLQAGENAEAVRLADSYGIFEMCLRAIEDSHWIPPFDPLQHLLGIAEHRYLGMLYLASESYEKEMDAGNDELAKQIGLAFGAPYDRLNCV